MKVLVAADLHGDLKRYRQAIDMCKKYECQELWLAGDLLPHFSCFTIEQYRYEQSKYWNEVLYPLLKSSGIIFRGIPGNDDVPEGDMDHSGLLYIVPTLVEIGDEIPRKVLFNPYMDHVDWYLWREVDREVYTDAVNKLVYESDIIITHQPPQGQLDDVHMTKRIGSRLLNYAIEEALCIYNRSNILCLFGHNHTRAGDIQRESNITYANVCVVDNISNARILDLDSMNIL